MTCKRCKAELFGMPEQEPRDWFLRCLEFGMKNIFTVSVEVVAGRDLWRSYLSGISRQKN
jgi:hypothetical protein